MRRERAARQPLDATDIDIGVRTSVSGARDGFGARQIVCLEDVGEILGFQHQIRGNGCFRPGVVALLSERVEKRTLNLNRLSPLNP